MKFLVDAQLPRRMTAPLNSAGCDAVHTLDLPDGNRWTDEQIMEFAEREQRAVVTKDADFVNSHLLSGRPAKLLLVSTGNISNRELEQLTLPLIPILRVEFQTHAFLELGQSGSPSADRLSTEALSRVASQADSDGSAARREDEPRVSSFQNSSSHQGMIQCRVTASRSGEPRPTGSARLVEHYAPP